MLKKYNNSQSVQPRERFILVKGRGERIFQILRFNLMRGWGERIFQILRFNINWLMHFINIISFGTHMHFPYSTLIKEKLVLAYQEHPKAFNDI
jgi:hypothetical protein